MAAMPTTRSPMRAIALRCRKDLRCRARPWLCAGLIGHRALRMAGDAGRIGIYGFGAAAHIVAQLARHEGRAMYAFTRPGDATAQAFARELGAVWAGGSDQPAPEPLDAAIIFAPVGALVPKALRDLAKGGIVVCAGIHMTDIPQFPYAILWGERRIVSVANLTRRDGVEFMALAGAGADPDHRRRVSVERRQRRAACIARRYADRCRGVVIDVTGRLLTKRGSTSFSASFRAERELGGFHAKVSGLRKSRFLVALLLGTRLRGFQQPAGPGVNDAARTSRRGPGAHGPDRISA